MLRKLEAPQAMPGFPPTGATCVTCHATLTADFCGAEVEGIDEGHAVFFGHIKRHTQRSFELDLDVFDALFVDGQRPCGCLLTGG